MAAFRPVRAKKRLQVIDLGIEHSGLQLKWDWTLAYFGQLHATGIGFSDGKIRTSASDGSFDGALIGLAQLWVGRV